MKTSASSLLVIALLTASSWAQDTVTRSPDPQDSSFASLRKALEAGKLIESAGMTETRAFNPVVNERWRGVAVSYGCYRKGQAPGVVGPSEAEILEDLNILVRYWSFLRIYGSDDDAERIIRTIHDHALPLRVVLGVWLEDEEGKPQQRAANVSQTLRALQLARRYPGEIAAISVGNEVQVFWSFHRMNPAAQVRYIRAVRTHSVVPVTAADDYNYWITPASKQIAGEIDFVMLHMYPLWNGKTIDSAMTWMTETYRAVRTVHPDKMIVVGETGWATAYDASKRGPGEQGTLIKGEVSQRGQELFLVALHDWVHTNNIATFLFEAFDEPWKGGGEKSGPNEIEKHWGVFYADRTPKPSFVQYLHWIQTKTDKGSGRD